MLLESFEQIRSNVEKEKGSNEQGRSAKSRERLWQRLLVDVFKIDNILLTN
jgi:hypothetical protein